MPSQGSGGFRGSMGNWPEESFAGALNGAGELAITTGQNLTNLQPSAVYTSAIPDANNSLWVETIDNNNAIVHNAGGAVNNGATVVVKFS